jgi:hypothetical protein
MVLASTRRRSILRWPCKENAMNRGKSIEALITKSRKSFEVLKADYQASLNQKAGNGVKPTFDPCLKLIRVKGRLDPISFYITENFTSINNVR